MSLILRRAVSALVLAAAVAFPAGAADLPDFVPKARFPSFTTAPTAASHAEAARLLAIPSAELPSFSAPAREAALAPAAASVAPLHAAAPVEISGAIRGAPATPVAASAAPLPGPAGPDASVDADIPQFLRASRAPAVRDASAFFDGAAARDALKRASDGGYAVAVLRHVGSGRLAVILGETHIKSAREAALAGDVLAQFTNYAKEGADTTSTWARRFNWKLRMIARRRLQTRWPNKYGHGSTILAASTLAQARAAASDSSQKPPAREFRLEIGHRPDFLENIAIWKPAVDKAVSAVFADALVTNISVIPASPPAAAASAAWLLAARIALNSYGMLGRALIRRWPGSPLGLLFPLDSGIIRARDKTMAANLARALKSLPDGEHVLAIVGKAHVPGIKRHLVKRHGFKEVGLNALARK